MVILSIGPRHTWHFCTQYCDIATKIYRDKKIILRHMFLWPSKVGSKNILWFIFSLYTLIHIFVKSLPWPIDFHGQQIYFYFNIFLSQYSVQKCLVCTVMWSLRETVSLLVVLLSRVFGLSNPKCETNRKLVFLTRERSALL